MAVTRFYITIVTKKIIILSKYCQLAPCDIPSECKKFLNEEEYNIVKEQSTRLVKENKENELIDFSIMANKKIAAWTYYNDFLPNGENDFIRYRDGVNAKSEVLNSINIPTLVIFGNEDECVLTKPIEVVEWYLKNNLIDSNIQIIEKSDHLYTGKYEELGKIIRNNID